VDENDYYFMENEDILCIENACEQLKSGNNLIINNLTNDKVIVTTIPCSDRQKQILFSGGLLSYIKSN